MSRVCNHRPHTDVELAPKHVIDALSLVMKRAVTLPEMVSKEDALVVKAVRKESREVDFIASTEAVDAHGDLVDQETWDLRDFLANPIILYAHDSYELPIGQATYVAVQNKQLVCTIKFTEVTERARHVFDLVVEKTLRAVSVGFRPVNGAWEMIDGKEVWVWRNQKLKEISVVPIGANPEALAKMEKSVGEFKGASPRAGNDPRVGAPAQPHNEKDAGAPGERKGHEIMKTAEQLAKELEEKSAEHKDAVQKLGAANVKLVETEQRAERAEASALVAEKAVAKANEKITSLEATAKTLETEHTKACADRDANAKKAEEATARLIDLEVDALIGDRITADEKEEYVQLRKSDEVLFKKMVAKRAPMGLTTRVTETDTKVAKADPNAPTAPTVTPQTGIDAFNSLGG